jgi:hypothetical protein
MKDQAPEFETQPDIAATHLPGEEEVDLDSLPFGHPRRLYALWSSPSNLGAEIFRDENNHTGQTLHPQN